MSEIKNKAPAIVGKAKEEKKPYFFKNRKSPGQSVKCFTGNCPKEGEWFRDTVTNHELVDGQVVHLTETEAEHLRQRGISKPIVQTDESGYARPTGQSYVDSRFELHPV